MNSGMLPAKALIPAYAGIRITAAGPLLNLTGFPLMHYCTPVQVLVCGKRAYKINIIIPNAAGMWSRSITQES